MKKGLIVLMMVLMPSIASAGMYKCSDAAGSSTYTDTPCVAGNMAVLKPNNTQVKNSQSPPSEPAEKEVYTKDIPALEAADAATKSCFKHSNTTELYLTHLAASCLQAAKNGFLLKM